ncbi:hypothetical protein [Streptomyces sp. MA5143a]|uniref:hypothetical protein n=1 Tax=Streptomyces sp. MA5143a TaxID=2083010 RepID=UPI000D261075|nr:hypothetical protein [Streptomyces sp. MA5143a]SPF03334.1 hypothetical protein SMA5143A_4107 [Streptomyces sp. MA5143a]
MSAPRPARQSPHPAPDAPRTVPDTPRPSVADGPPPADGPPLAAAPSPAHSDTATDVVRWAAFSCVLVPVVLVWYGTSLAGATGAALGLAAVTGACRVLLRQSERGAAHAADLAQAAHSTHSTHGTHGDRSTGAAHTAHTARPVPPSRSPHLARTEHAVAEEHSPQRGRHGRTDSGAHRGGRNPGPGTPVD